MHYQCQKTGNCIRKKKPQDIFIYSHTSLELYTSHQSFTLELNEYTQLKKSHCFIHNVTIRIMLLSTVEFAVQLK